MSDPLSGIGTREGAGWWELSVADAAPRLDVFDLVDVREPHEFTGELGHVAGARSVPLATVDPRTGFDRDRPVLVICRSGGRSARAAAALVAAGFPRVYNLTGGMLAWNEARLPIAR
ncbi:MAG: rhodanese-like domain-containing protein [Myxococcota bacterium]